MPTSLGALRRLTRAQSRREVGILKARCIAHGVD